MASQVTGKKISQRFEWFGVGGVPGSKKGQEMESSDENRKMWGGVLQEG